MNDIDLSPYPSLRRLKAWFLEDALPVWLTLARDESRGHFHEGLALNGRPLPTATLRVRTSARMIYVYADAARLGVGPQGAGPAAARAFVALQHDARTVFGYVRSIDRVTGDVLDPAVDLYDQACVLLALAALHRATGAVEYRAEAERLLGLIDGHLSASSGGWAEDQAGTLPRRQNPHMHLFEALVCLSATTGDPVHRARVEALCVLMRGRFMDSEGVLREFFGPHWEIGERWKSERLDPGHMAEWAWLLHVACPSAIELPRRLLGTALQLGKAPDDERFLVDEVSPEGKVLSNGRRLWLQAELIKACLATGDIDRADDTAGALFETYLANTPRGTWRDRFDLAGNFIGETIPASSCYHLWTVVAPLCSG